MPEKTLHIAIQGIAGSFHHEAANLLIHDRPFELVECDTFPEVFSAVHKGTADYGVSAVENSLNGSINSVYRLLHREKLWIIGEQFLHIEQYLIGHEPYSLQQLNVQVTEVMSHPVALAQCEAWLDTNLPFAMRKETKDTAESVRYVMEEKNSFYTAIAGKGAAEMYGAHIIEGPINDDKHNYTRFLLLSREKQPVKDADKTSIIFKTDHTPGALYRALGAFDRAKVNLSKLDSHPIPGDKWHHIFYADFDAGLDKNFSHPAIEDMRTQGVEVIVVGSYKASPLPS